MASIFLYAFRAKILGKNDNDDLVCADNAPILAWFIDQLVCR